MSISLCFRVEGSTRAKTCSATLTGQPLMRMTCFLRLLQRFVLTETILAKMRPLQNSPASYSVVKRLKRTENWWTSFSAESTKGFD